MAFASVLAEADVKAALAGCSGEFASTFQDFSPPCHFGGRRKAKTSKHSKLQKNPDGVSPMRLFSC